MSLGGVWRHVRAKHLHGEYAICGINFETKESVIFWASHADVLALPLLEAQTEPEEPEEPKEPTVSIPDLSHVVRAVDEVHPHLLQTNDADAVREFYWRAAWALQQVDSRFGMLSKSAGENHHVIAGQRVALDAVAYGEASAIGYATVLNLHFALSYPSSPDVTANRVFSTLALHLVTSLVVGYGLAEVRFGQPSPFLLTLTIALAAFITGVAIPIRAGLVNASLSLDNTATNPLLNISATKPLQGLAFSLGLLVALSFVVSFLFNSAGQREREAAVREL